MDGRPLLRLIGETVFRALTIPLAWWFPSTCLHCHRWVRPYRHLCDDCRYAAPRVVPPLCIKCGRPVVAPGLSAGFRGLCPSCLERPLALDGVRAWGRMESPLREWVHALKYRGLARVADRLAEWMAEDMYPWLQETGAEAITFVPLHRRRRWERGFNQAERLARALARRWDRPCVDVLVRRRYERPQVGQTAARRWDSVQGAFAVRRRRNPRAFERWLIVDDVMTTGATLHACAQALKRAGARHVYGLTVATTPAADVG